MLAAFAKETDPVGKYLEKPEVQSFRNAVNALADSLKTSSDLYSAKANLAYIANAETNRLIDELRADEKDLSAGQRFMVANMLLGMDRNAEANELYAGLNKDYPNWSCPWRHRGEANYKMKDYKAAETALIQAIKTKEEHYDAYVWMAMTLREMGRYEEALSNMDIARKIAPEAAESEHEDISAQDFDNLYRELKAKVK